MDGESVVAGLCLSFVVAMLTASVEVASLVGMNVVVAMLTLFSDWD